MSELKIENYRNLNGIHINFHPDITFLVGENNLGKSNVLALLNTIFNYQSFRREDFTDQNRDIEITITLILNEFEKGMFSDLFDPSDSNKVNLILSQESPDEFINLVHKETGISLSNNTIKKIIHINYDSLRNPKNELSFEKGKGSGKFFKFLIERYLKNNESNDLDFIDEEKLEKLKKNLNEIFQKIKSFKDFEVNVSTHKEVENLLSRILHLTDSEELGINSSGYGVQYSIMVGLAILEKISYLNEKKLEKILYENEDEEKIFPLIFSLDEPEIHLHPYMQRSLIKYINNIIHNMDRDFKELLRDLFNIDRIEGQSIIVTHSPNILLNDYKQIVRFYKDSKGDLLVKKGTDINLPKNIEKHLLMNMQYIKETFFSKCVIIVEGESEYGCMDIFATNLGVELDDTSISVLKANGAESILPLMKLFEEFGINSVGIIDKDKYIEKETTLKDVERLFHTECWDFEDEIVSKCFSKDRISVLEGIIEEYDNLGLNRSIQSGKLKKIAKKYQIEITTELSGNYKFTEALDGEVLRLMYLAWFDLNKSVILGREIGSILDTDLIPEVYEKAIVLAKEIISNDM
ncbi:ATP-dependent nuclease [Virgibacillus halodenitrificans]|uniref:ATP-dependent nuclease n=1 Tax=Virgibacillus halodenitrificans TaxID=1482 RepID=UPI001F3D8389|nr:AAA family ATPase [Virgibacillus halodenitrificans]